MTAPRRCFVGWDQPLLERVVEHLAGAEGAIVSDLSGDLVLVPTRQAGRRLREALAVKAAESEGGVLPPRVLTPEALVLSCLAPGQRLATEAEGRLAWARVLMAAPGELCEPVFAEPVTRDLSWGWSLAGALQRLRRTLGERPLDLSQAATLQQDSPEPERWSCLAELEQRYFQELGSRGLADGEQAKARAARQPHLDVLPSRIVVAGVPDLPPVTEEVLRRLVAQGATVEILIAAPVSEQENFDAWGRPSPDCWRTRADLPLRDDQILLLEGPEALASAVESLANRHPEPPLTLAVGALERGIVSHLHEKGGEGVYFDPEGRPLVTHELFHLLRLLAALLRSGTFDDLGRLLRNVQVLRMLRRRLNPPCGATRLLLKWDRFRRKHLPGTLEGALEFDEPPVSDLVREALQMLEPLRQGGAAAVAEWLTQVHAGRRFARSPESQAFRAVAARLMTALGEVERAAAQFGQPLEVADLLEMALELAGGHRVEGERPEEAVDLSGWLELHWEDAPHLVLAGMNEGLVPDVIVGDPWLSDTVRRRLGLRTNDHRLARDAYLLRQMLECRREVGRVDVLVGRHSADGDPLRPSRLLFQCPENLLPERSRRLYLSEDAPPEPLPQPSIGWKLSPPAVEPLTRLRVGAFADYLKCPYRFYLKHRLGMERVDPARPELDALAFGTLCHGAIERFSREPHRPHDRDGISQSLAAHLEDVARETYGSRPSLPVRWQIDAARQRLQRFARWQAEQHGWEIIAVEISLQELLGEPLVIGGVEITGRIDRIERKGGAYRILDFKTSDQPSDAKKHHLVSERKPAAVPAYATLGLDRWINLQLPLYAHALHLRHGVVPEVGHVRLACGDAPVDSLWEDFNQSTLESAVRCAAGVVADIQQSRFWPPDSRIKFDEFESITFGAPAQYSEAPALSPA